MTKIKNFSTFSCRAPHGRVDWNIKRTSYIVCYNYVAPLMGAWIEIYPLEKAVVLKIVAPLMGAWIEIKFYKVRFSWSYGSRPSWARGLKFGLIQIMSNHRQKVAPLMGAWIEIIGAGAAPVSCTRRAPHGRVDWNKKLNSRWRNKRMSRPSWARGLKS